MQRIDTEIALALEKAEIKNAAMKAKEKADKVKREQEKKGWLWLNVSEKTNIKAFVPCDKDGKPTKKGEELIKDLKVKLGIK